MPNEQPVFLSKSTLCQMGGEKLGVHGVRTTSVKDRAGNLVIVEAKGGAGRLRQGYEVGDEQMSQNWIKAKIAELKNAGQDKLADELDKAWKSRTLKAMVVKTRTSRSKACPSG